MSYLFICDIYFLHTVYDDVILFFNFRFSLFSPILWVFNVVVRVINNDLNFFYVVSLAIKNNIDSVSEILFTVTCFLGKNVNRGIEIKLTISKYKSGDQTDNLL